MTDTFVPKPAKTQGRIQYDLEAGVMVERSTGKRVIWIPEDLMQSIVSVSNRMLRAGAPAMLQNMGFYWGEAMFKQVESHLLATKPHLQKIQDLSVKEFVGYVDEIWSQNGFGRFEMAQSFDRIFVNLYFSFLTKVIDPTGKPFDHLYAGLYAGLFSGLLGQRVSCVEIMCVSSGYDYCRFLLGKEESLDEVRGWIAAGTPYEQIVERLQKPSPAAAGQETK